MSNNKSTDNFKENIHEEKKRDRATAKQVLKLAKQQEKERIEKGSRYVRIDEKTLVLKHK
jgi:hypothetical protein